VIENIFKERMSPESLRPIISRTISESYKGTCEDIIELDDEEIYSSMYNSRVMNKPTDDILKEELAKEKENMSSNKILMIDHKQNNKQEVKYEDDEKQMINIEENISKGLENYLNPFSQTDIMHSDITDIKKPKDEFNIKWKTPSKSFGEFRRKSKLVHSFTNDFDQKSVDNDKPKINLANLQTSMKKLSQIISSKTPQRHKSINSNKLIRSTNDISTNSFAKKNWNNKQLEEKRFVHNNFKSFNNGFSDKKVKDTQIVHKEKNNDKNIMIKNNTFNINHSDFDDHFSNSKNV